jgi:hypothetical protein
VPKLNLTIAEKRLREADEMKAVSVAKVRQPDKTPGLVKVKEPTTSIRLTRVNKINNDNIGMQGQEENAKAGLKIPTAEFGGKLVDQTPKMTFKNVKRGKQGAAKVPPVKTVPGKTQINPKHREISDPIKRTETGGGFGQSSAFMSGNGGAEESKEKGQKYGNRTKTPTVKAPSPEHIGPESPDAGEVTVKQTVMHHKVSQINTKKGPLAADPSDGGDRKKSFPHAPNMADNVRESVRSGVVVVLGNKVKHQFGLASNSMLGRLVETYKQHGYDLKIVSTGKAAWKRDRKLIQTVWESLSAEYNFVPESAKSLRRVALNRLSTISQPDFNELYESRQAFVDTIVSGYEQIETAVRKRFLESLELMMCQVRFLVNGQTVDAEITTEAHDPGMALRQVRNVIKEQYGLDTRIVHVFVDGSKFLGSQIPAWKAKV